MGEIMKKCGRCQIVKEDTEFSPSQLERSGGVCRPCCTEKAQNYRNTHRDKVRKYEQEYRPKYLEEHKEEKAAYQHEYYENNKEKFKVGSKKHREANRDELLEYAKTYYQLHKEEFKAYSKKSRQLNREKRNISQHIKRQTDPFEKIRHNVSNLIHITIKRNGSSKNGNSIINHLGYNIEQLKEHLEKQFEPWMSWDNWSKYNTKIWNDNDQTTWTWQLDHIIPQADLPYTAMTDDNFKTCWSLNNLRPYSAKLNSIDGANRIRHTKILMSPNNKN
jgi:hypothetical protein